jgi:hypothetical protein
MKRGYDRYQIMIIKCELKPKPQPYTANSSLTHLTKL